MRFKNFDARRFELAHEVATNTSAMLGYWDKDLICRFANAAYKEWFGYSPENMINKITLKQLLGPLYEKNLPHIKKALQGEVQVFERDITIRSGECRNTIATYTPDIVNGKVEGFYVHVADISLLKKNELSQGAAPVGLPGNQDTLNAVERTLRSFLFIGFPGIPTLAKQHLVSESKLKRDFKAKYNSTIFNYFRQLQMELAHKYISQKTYSKKQMAALMKFSNPSNFLVCYKKFLQEKAAKEHVSELEKANDNLFKIFVSQSPIAIGMFNVSLTLIAASAKWHTDFRLQESDVNNISFYDFFPGDTNRWKTILKKCLEGDTCHGEEMFTKEDSKCWLRWNMRPWKNAKQQTGGLIVFTEDITLLKQVNADNKLILDILLKTSEITRIGAWDKNMETGVITWSKITREILEVPEDYQPSQHPELHFYKNKQEKNKVSRLLKLAIEYQQSFDFSADMITAKGNNIRVRVIGFPEFVNGNCKRLYGIFQQIDG